jgi:hypothetical protein
VAGEGTSLHCNIGGLLIRRRVTRAGEKSVSEELEGGGVITALEKKTKKSSGKKDSRDIFDECGQARV